MSAIIDFLGTIVDFFKTLIDIVVKLCQDLVEFIKNIIHERDLQKGKKECHQKQKTKTKLKKNYIHHTNQKVKNQFEIQYILIIHTLRILLITYMQPITSTKQKQGIINKSKISDLTKRSNIL